MTANIHHLDVKCKYFAIKHSLLVTSTVLTNLRTTLFLSKSFSYCLKSTLYNSFLNQLVPICIHTHVIHSVFMAFYEICIETEFYSFILFSWSLIMSFSSSIFSPEQYPWRKCFFCRVSNAFICASAYSCHTSWIADKTCASYRQQNVRSETVR